MIRLAALALFAWIQACERDETVAGYGAAGKTWRLTELDGRSFNDRATLAFSDVGQIAGDSPCNRYTASMTVPYPLFGIDAFASTDMACITSDAETRFFAALAEMTLSEILGDTLILRTEDDREMVFKASE